MKVPVKATLRDMVRVCLKKLLLIDSTYIRHEVRSACGLGRVRWVSNFRAHLKLSLRFSELKIRTGDKQVNFCMTLQIEGKLIFLGLQQITWAWRYSLQNWADRKDRGQSVSANPGNLWLKVWSSTDLECFQAVLGRISLHAAEYKSGESNALLDSVIVFRHASRIARGRICGRCWNFS